MIRFETVNGLLKPVLPTDATGDEVKAADTIAQRLNKIQGSGENYKTLMESLDKELQGNNSNARDYIDAETITAVENFYQKATGLTPWDSSKHGVPLDSFNAKFYAQQVPEEVKKWNEAATAVSFGGKKISDIDITKKYPDLDSFLHSEYTFVGAPAGLLGEPRDLEVYKETLRAPTDAERQILREALLGKPGGAESLAEMATQNYINKQGEQTFGALSADALKATLSEYANALKKQQMSDMLEGMGMPSVGNIKQDIKNAILGDSGVGGYMNFGAGSNIGKSLSDSLDRSLGMGSSVQYNWQKWFDETLAKRYEDRSQITDPTDASKTYELEKEFAKSFVEDYLKPRFDTSKSISEFVSYMDVKDDEQNVLQTQLASNALKQYANEKAKEFITSLGAAATQKEFDPNFYWNPELLSGTDVTNKKSAYEQQKQNVQDSWDKRNTDEDVKNGKSWKELAYEYGVDLENKSDFARLHYSVIGKNKNYDPVADTYNRQDLAAFIQGPLAEALQGKKASFGNPVFLDFVSAEQKAAEFVDKINISDLPEDIKKQLEGLGYDTSTDSVAELQSVLTGLLSTDPAFQIRESIRQLNEQRIKPTQEQLGFGYIQRDSDEKVQAPAGGSALFDVFQKAGYGGSESEFYAEFFPDATEEDKNLMSPGLGKSGSTKGVQGLMGFSIPDFSDPFAAMGSLDQMLSDDSINKKETYKPRRSNYFKYFTEEEDEEAPSFFGGGIGSLFG
jgi:hypothetical protein